MKKKNYVGKALMFGALLAPIGMPTVSVLADSFYQNQTSAHAADITNWSASTPEQITNKVTTQNINPKQLNGQQYVIQWGDTLWGISQATGISVEKLAYDNNIQNIDLIYAGDVLILNRDGQVPTDYHVTGSGHRCANSKVVINNYYGDHNRVVIKNTTFVSVRQIILTTVFHSQTQTITQVTKIPKILKIARSHLHHHQNLRNLKMLHQAHQVQQVDHHLLLQAQQQAVVKANQVQKVLRKKNCLMMLSKIRFKANSNKFINKNAQVAQHGLSSHM